MAVDYNFVKAVLREYTAEERAAISLLAEKECQLDGVVSTMDIWDLSNTYKAIILLAGGDLVRERVGRIYRERKNISAILEIYRENYRQLLIRAGIDYTEEGRETPALPEVIT